MICRYCGLETGAGLSHCSQAECIQALNAEIERAKRLIGRGRELSAGSRQDRHDGSSQHEQKSEHPERAYIEPA